MKTLVKITLAVGITLFSISESYAQFGNKKIKGNGNVTTKTVNTQDYDEIRVIGSLDVHLERGNEGSITVTTDSNIQEYIVVEVENNSLKIRVQKNINVSTNKGIHVTVPFETISSVSLTGSGDVNTKDTIKTDSFNASVTGSGDVTLDVTSTNIDAKVIGSGDLTISGKTKSLEVKVTGSGDFKGKGLKAENTQAYVSGSGDIVVLASKSIKARVNGSGDIEYSGNPDTADTKVLGSGSISPR
ncbi:head GIN domain-containing protein [Ulvibacter litoralis]|uniref:Putative auto-transporter adhesin, head GIN domain n=1 Tax=Ulvibacter litoralis TaxID=227084 RepID=A0A1G7FUV9_9FLAO|nr:head GIN domain-containing protein [Ulvibacter litoralis]GHC63906.1 DUF2807 domain-containing protein [Ulvibacter litoralis]SDE79515.1 Putative auto-transporter adhesin, head GIN domain [Ulvibacter litoralis]